MPNGTYDQGRRIAVAEDRRTTSDIRGPGEWRAADAAVLLHGRAIGVGLLNPAEKMSRQQQELGQIYTQQDERGYVMKRSELKK